MNKAICFHLRNIVLTFVDVVMSKGNRFALLTLDDDCDNEKKSSKPADKKNVSVLFDELRIALNFILKLSNNTFL